MSSAMRGGADVDLSHLRRTHLSRIFRPSKEERDEIIARRKSNKHAPAPLIKWKTKQDLIQALVRVQALCGALPVDEEDPLYDLADRVLNLRGREAIREECAASIRNSGTDGELPADREQRDAAQLSVDIDRVIQEKGLADVTSARDWDAAWKRRPIFKAERDAVQDVLNAALAYLQLGSTSRRTMMYGKCT